MNTYLVTLLKIDHSLVKEFGSAIGGEIKLIFIEPPKSYKLLLNCLPNVWRKLLAIDKASVEFYLDKLSSEHFSQPLFKNNPTGREVWNKDFPHARNMVGRLIVEPVRCIK